MFAKKSILAAVLMLTAATSAFAQHRIPDPPPSYQADLTAPAPTSPGAEWYADGMTLHVKVSNRSDGAATGFHVRVTFNCNTIVTAEVVGGPIAPQSSEWIAVPMPNACIFQHLRKGLCIFSVRIDSQNEVAETVETNNESTLFWMP